MANTGSSPDSSVGGPLDRGYGVNPYPNLTPEFNGPTAWLRDSAGSRIWLWITQVDANFSMGGSFAQSQKTRSFYARSLGEAVITVTGISPSSAYYQKLGEFVRNVHVHTFSGTAPTYTLKNNAGVINPGLIQLVTNPDDNPSRPLMKGPRQTYNMVGYIDKISRGAERFNWFPTFTFDFTIVYTLGDKFHGLFITNPSQVWKLLNYTQLVQEAKHRDGLPFVTNPGTKSTNSSGTPNNNSPSGPNTPGSPRGVGVPIKRFTG